jgi:hypothetical protein
MPPASHSSVICATIAGAAPTRALVCSQWFAQNMGQEAAPRLHPKTRVFGATTLRSLEEIQHPNLVHVGSCYLAPLSKVAWARATPQVLLLKSEL